MLIKFLVSTDVNGKHHERGDKRELDDEIAQGLIGAGKAELVLDVVETVTPPFTPVPFVVDGPAEKVKPAPIKIPVKRKLGPKGKGKK